MAIIHRTCSYYASKNSKRNVRRASLLKSQSISRANIARASMARDKIARDNRARVDNPVGDHDGFGEDDIVYSTSKYSRAIVKNKSGYIPRVVKDSVFNHSLKDAVYKFGAKSVLHEYGGMKRIQQVYSSREISDAFGFTHREQKKAKGSSRALESLAKHKNR